MLTLSILGVIIFLCEFELSVDFLGDCLNEFYLSVLILDSGTNSRYFLFDNFSS